jgi:uncharacterized protein (DUF1810 family)
MTDVDLIRFLDAQDQIFDQVVEQLANSRKEGIPDISVIERAKRVGLLAIASQRFR